MRDGINSLNNRKKKNRKSLGSIRRNDDQLPQDPLDHASILNGHFASVGPRLATSIPNSNKLFTQYLPKINFNGSFVLEPVLSTEIELELMRNPSNKSHGVWSCPIRLLKYARHIIVEPLATLINISVERGSFLSKLKHVVIISIFKDGDETDPSNYRLISLLSVFNRIFEKIMYDRLKQFLNKHNIFYNYQYGFRERRLTEHAILDIVNRI